MRFSILILLSVLFVPFAFSADKAKSFNPDVGVNFLGLGQVGSNFSRARTVKPREGLQLQEVELQFASDVDAYFRAVAFFAIKQESGSSGFSIDPEEIYAESISLPGFTVRAGKFKQAMGRHNSLHTHAFPFIDAPLVNQRLLGDEGLNENAVSVSALLPASWFSEVTLQGFSLANDALFNSRNSGDMGGLARIRNLWDLRESLTMEHGISGAVGHNQFGYKSTILGSDLTLKWRPTEGGKYKSVSWSTEYFLAQRPGLVDATSAESQQKLGGLASWIQYQFAERWWLQGRYEYLGLPRSPSLSVVTKQSALLGFFPSEFSGLRLQYDWIQDRARPKKDYAVALQYNISIGAHPAHAY